MQKTAWTITFKQFSVSQFWLDKKKTLKGLPWTFFTIFDIYLIKYIYKVVW